MVAMGCASPVLAQQDIQKALEHFFELGLPDTKNAKWIMLTSPRSGMPSPTMPGGWQARYSGDAWLLKDEGGEVEILKPGGAMLRGKKGVIQFKEGNLDKDLALFAKALKSVSDDGDSRQGTAAAGSLLFLAHMQRRGKTDFVRENLPAVLAMMPSPSLVLDGAISMLADARVGALRERWFATGDATAYAKELDALAARFTRGWAARDAVALFTAKLREQKRAALAVEPDAAAAAALLLTLKPEELLAFPRGNWFLGISDEDSSEAMFDDEGNSLPSREKPKQGGRVDAFFADKRKAALALGKLLGDGRFVRVNVNEFSGSNRSHSWNDSKTRAQEIQEAYAQMQRPLELGEFAKQLLAPLLPESLRGDGEAENSATVAWLKSTADRSDEDLAWEYLKGSDSTYDGDFRTGINFLVDRGSPATLVKLRDVLFDPAVWNSSSLDEMIPLTEKYLKRSPADAAFEAKLRDTVKRGLAASAAEQSRFPSGLGDAKKQIDAAQKAQLKLLDGLFKPGGGVLEQLAELNEMDEKEATAAFGVLSQTLGKKSPAELEAPIFITAAKLKSPMLKQQLLQTLMMSTQRGKTVVPPLNDAAAIEAATALLADQTASPNRWDPSREETVATVTAGVLLMVHGDQKHQEEWQKLGMTAPSLVKKLAHEHALALVKGQPVPPFPNAANVSADKVTALIAALTAFPAEKLDAALSEKSADEQLAVFAHLEKAAEWPAPFIAARFTVTKFINDKPGLLGDVKWVGRRFDESLISEMRDAMTKSVIANAPCQIVISSSPGVEGVGVHIINPKQVLKFPPKQLDQMGMLGLSGKPQPHGIVGVGIQSAGDWRGANYQFPVWKEEAATREWREKYGKSKPVKEDEKDDGGNQRFDSNPAKFEQKLRDFLSLKPEHRGAFRVMIYSAIITDKKDDSSDEDN